MSTNLSEPVGSAPSIFQPLSRKKATEPARRTVLTTRGAEEGAVHGVVGRRWAWIVGDAHGAADGPRASWSDATHPVPVPATYQVGEHLFRPTTQGVFMSVPTPLPVALAAIALAWAATDVSAQQAPAAPAPPERRSTLADQQAVAITIYNEDLALVKDTRKLPLDDGANRCGAAGRERAHAARNRATAQPLAPRFVRPAGAELRLRPAHAGQAAGEVRGPQRACGEDPPDHRR